MKPLVVIPLRPGRMVLAGVLLSALGALLLCQGRSPAARLAPIPAEPPPELRLVPPDTLMVLHLRLADLASRPLAREVLKWLTLRPLGGKDETIEPEVYGSKFSDIEGMAYLMNLRDEVNIITTRRPFDRARIRQQIVGEGVEIEHRGKKFYSQPRPRRTSEPDLKVAPTPPGLPPPPPPGGFKEGAFPLQDRKDAPQQQAFDPWSRSVHFLSERTYAVGTARAISHLIENGKKPADDHPLSGALAQAGKHHLVLGATLTEDMAREARTALGHGVKRDPFGMLAYSFRPLLDMKHAVLTADLAEESRVAATVTFPNDRTAERGREAVEAVLHSLRGGLLLLEDTFQDELGDLKPGSALLKLTSGLRAGLNEATIKVEGRTVRAAVKAPVEAATFKAIMAEAAPRLQLSANQMAAQGNLKQLSLAIINYADAHNGRMPPAVLYSRDGKPLFSWRVAILPYIEQEVLYKQLKLDEPWDSEHNKKVLAKVKMPKVFELPGIQAPENHTFFQIFQGVGILSEKQRPIQFPASFTDGTSNTILLVEAAESVHWAAPGDIVYSDRVSPLKQVGNHYRKGTLAAMADGSVRRLPPRLTERTLRIAITPQDGQVLGPDWDGDDEPRRGAGSSGPAPETRPVEPPRVPDRKPE